MCEITYTYQVHTPMKFYLLNEISICPLITVYSQFVKQKCAT